MRNATLTATVIVERVVDNDRIIRLGKERGSVTRGSGG